MDSCKLPGGLGALRAMFAKLPFVAVWHPESHEKRLLTNGANCLLLTIPAIITIEDIHRKSGRRLVIEVIFRCKVWESLPVSKEARNPNHWSMRRRPEPNAATHKRDTLIAFWRKL